MDKKVKEEERSLSLLLFLWNGEKIGKEEAYIKTGFRTTLF